MEKLPLELQLFVIEYLDALDIFHLELTCRHFRGLISTSAAIVWRQCLRQHCVQNGLFWPSFCKLKRTTELKEACTAGYRLYQSYQRATATDPATTGETNDAISCEITPLSFLPPDLGDDIYLVPGGRILVTFHTGKWICVWDLTQGNHLQGADFEPTLLLRHRIERFKNAVYIDVIDDTIVIIAALTSADNRSEGSTLTHELLQLSFSEENRVFLQSLGHLSIILPGATTIQFMSFGPPNVIFHFTDRTTLIWDVRHHQVSGWNIQDVDPLFELFSVPGFVFYIDSHGLHGVALPPFRTIENDTVSSSSFSNDSDPKSPLTPLFTLFHLHPHREPVVEQVFPPDLCSPRLISANNGQGLLYEIKEIEQLSHPTKPQTRRAIYRYRFDFQPDNPTQSTLRLIEIATPRSPPYVHARSTSELNQHSYQGLNGRLGSVWTEEAQDFGPTKSLFFSFSSYFHPSSSLEDGPRVIYHTELNLLPLVNRHWPMDEHRRAVVCEFCPNSGKVVVLWDLLQHCLRPAHDSPDNQSGLNDIKMRKLPLELQLFVMEQLDALDIYHLELTCRDFRDLIKSSEASVWRHCLRQRCIQDNLFWPSFNKLELAAELKEACTTGYRLYKGYERAVAAYPTSTEGSNPHISCQITPLSLQFPHSEEGRISDVYLVPGGRFLVTFQAQKWLCVWDLAPEDGLRGTTSEPILVFLKAIEGLERVVYVDFGTAGIIILVSIAGDNFGSASEGNFEAHELLQLNFAEKDGFSLQSLGRLCIILPDDERTFLDHISKCQNNIFFYFNDSTTLAWDVLNCQVSGWKIQGVTDVFELFSLPGFAFYINADALHGVAIPPFRSIENCTVSISPSSPDLIDFHRELTPFITLSHFCPHRIYFVDQVFTPEVCNPRFPTNKGDALLYEVQEVDALYDPPTPQTRRSKYRYRLEFCRDNPDQSTLHLVEIASVQVPPYARSRTSLDLVQHSYQGCNGRLGAVWAGAVFEPQEPTDSLFLSFSASFDPSPSSALKDASGSIHEAELNLVPMVTRHWKEDEDAFMCEFCPSSGTVAVLWGSENDGSTSVTLYKLQAM